MIPSFVIFAFIAIYAAVEITCLAVYGEETLKLGSFGILIFCTNISHATVLVLIFIFGIIWHRKNSGTQIQENRTDNGRICLIGIFVITSINLSGASFIWKSFTKDLPLYILAILPITSFWGIILLGLVGVITFSFIYFAIICNFFGECKCLHIGNASQVSESRNCLIGKIIMIGFTIYLIILTIFSILNFDQATEKHIGKNSVIFFLVVNLYCYASALLLLRSVVKNQNIAIKFLDHSESQTNSIIWVRTICTVASSLFMLVLSGLICADFFPLKSTLPIHILGMVPIYLAIIIVGIAFVGCIVNAIYYSFCKCENNKEDVQLNTSVNSETNIV